MAGLSKDELNKLKAELKAQADLQRKLNEDSGAYYELLKDIKQLHKDIAQAKKTQVEQEAKAVKAAKAYDDEVKKGVNSNSKLVEELRIAKDLEETKLGIIKDEIKEITKMTSELTKQAKEATSVANIFSNVRKDIVSITKTVKQSYGSFKQWSGTFDIDKSIRMSATQMGLLTKQTDSFRNSLDYAGQQTASFGVGIGELAKLQADFSNELGRSVMLGETGLVSMGQMAQATGLGAEGTAKMAADMEQQGISAERTASFVEQTMNDSTKMGINASKVIKNIQANIKLLNKYNFKGGIKGLAEMAKTVTKLGVGMDFVAGMADKLFDIEGAVDMSAQLQVMGGAWAKLADPFKLMYMARNDMAGLTEEIGKAAESSVKFNKEGSDFEISAMEMHRLRKIAEQTGIAYDDLATAGKNARKQTETKKQLNFNVDPEMQEFIANTAKWNNGKATIEVSGQPKLLKELSKADITVLKTSSASLRQRAEDTQTFDDKLKNIVSQLKQYLLPFVKALDNGLRPVVNKLTGALSDPKLLRDIKSAAETAAKAISLVGKFLGDNPAKAIITAIAGLGVMEVGKWYINGLALGKGFNSVANGGGSGVGNTTGFSGGLKGIKTGAKMVSGGKVLGGLGTMTKGLGKIALPLNLISAAIDGITNSMDNNLSITDKFLKTLDQNKGMALGATIGSVVPGIGTAVGAGIGGIVDAFTPEIGNYGKEVNDGLFTSPIKDGKLGKDFSKGRGIVQGGKITPIDNKDDLIAMKPNGPVDKTIRNGTNSTMKIEFGEIRFKFDELKVTSPGSPGVSIDLLKDQQFIRSITRMVHSETEKVINGGMNKG